MSRAPPKPSPTNPSTSDQQNQYIPQFISRKPFYISDDKLSEADYLEHQRLQSLPQDTLANSKWYDRGRKLGPAATKFRKGACENCGAMTHKTKECLSRPRKQGAKWSGKDIQADEIVQDVKLGWDAKRDRWNGYDAREYSAVVKEYEELEALGKAAAATSDHPKQDADADADEAGGDNPETESAKYAEETDMGRNQPTSTRNLRIREDTAKYLLNLDLDSAKYDPKTRSMAEAGTGTAPTPPTTTNQTSSSSIASALLADENFTRTSGDAAEFEKAQRYAWETQERGTAGATKLHLQANPTEGEMLRKQQSNEAATRKEASRRALLERYGGEEHLVAEGVAPFRAAGNERYVEYEEGGGVKGGQRKRQSSKYAEDVLRGNHTEVWGSWWLGFRWGYGCCHSMVVNSYCTGEQGRRAFEDAKTVQEGGLLGGEEGGEKEGGIAAADESPQRHGGDDDGGGGSLESKSAAAAPTAKKRTLQEMRDGVTQEEMEAFKRNRVAADDPMAAFLGRDGDGDAGEGVRRHG